MTFNNSPETETQRNTVLVATFDGKPDIRIEEVVNQYYSGKLIRWIRESEIPSTPPPDTIALMLNIGDVPDKNAYNEEGVLVERLTWDTRGKFAGWSKNH